MEVLLGLLLTPSPNSYSQQLLTHRSEAIEDLTGGVTTELFTTDILDKDKFWSEEIMKVNEKFLFSCATGTFDSWQGSDGKTPPPSDILVEIGRKSRNQLSRHCYYRTVYRFRVCP